MLSNIKTFSLFSIFKSKFVRLLVLNQIIVKTYIFKLVLLDVGIFFIPFEETQQYISCLDESLTIMFTNAKF